MMLNGFWRVKKTVIVVINGEHGTSGSANLSGIFQTFSHYDVGQVAMSMRSRCLHQKTYQFSHPRTCTLIGHNRFIANICFSASPLIPALAKNSNEELKCWLIGLLCDFPPSFLTPALIFSRRTQPISFTRQTHHHCLSDTFGLHSKMDCFQPLVLAGFLYTTFSFHILTVGAYFHAGSDGYLIISWMMQMIHASS